MSFLIRAKNGNGQHTAGSASAAEALVRLVETAQQGFETVECIDDDGNAHSQHDLLARVDIAPVPLPRSVKEL